MATIRQLRDSLKRGPGKQKLGRERLVATVSEYYNPYYRTILLLPVFDNHLPSRLFWTPSHTCQFYKKRPEPEEQLIGTWTRYWDPRRKRMILQSPKDVKPGKIELLSTVGVQDSDSWYFTSEDGTRERLGAYDEIKFRAPLHE